MRSCAHCAHSVVVHHPDGCGITGCTCEGFGARIASSPTLGPNLAERDLEMRLGGFADAEGLALAMVSDMAEKEKDKAAGALKRAVETSDELSRTAWEIGSEKHRARAQVLEEVELALRMGQHRAAEYGDTDLDPATAKQIAGRLAKAHQQLANRLRGKAGSGKACEGGRTASGKLNKEERVRRARNAAESRYNGTKSKQGGAE